jgi:hypothetical protein
VDAVKNSAARPSQQPAVAPESAGAETVIELPPGLSVPAALAGKNPLLNLAPNQQKLADKISDDFMNQVEAGNSGTQGGGKASTDGVESSEQNWRRAQQSADDRYRLLFGDAAYNQQSLNAAKAKATGSAQGQ